MDLPPPFCFILLTLFCALRSLIFMDIDAFDASTKQKTNKKNQSCRRSNRQKKKKAQQQQKKEKKKDHTLFIDTTQPKQPARRRCPPIFPDKKTPKRASLSLPCIFHSFSCSLSYFFPPLFIVACSVFSLCVLSCCRCSICSCSSMVLYTYFNFNKWCCRGGPGQPLHLFLLPKTCPGSGRERNTAVAVGDKTNDRR